MRIDQVWFQNRRAKWRKQARLSLLQDAWRLRCLGLTNSPVVLPNDRQRHSSSPPPPQSQPQLSSSSDATSPSPGSQNMSITLPKINVTDAKMTIDGNDGPAQNDGFTLMHPAFQNVQHKRKYYNNLDRNGTIHDEQHSFFTNIMQTDLNAKKLNQDLNSVSNVRFMQNYANRMTKDHDSGDSSGESSDSEEIDLTTNGCIDFSNNNNGEKSENIKKC